MKSQRYIVVTPCRNEEKNLPNLVQSMIAQTIIPELWVVVDDGSTDKTREIIAEAEKKCEWIKAIRLKKHTRYMGGHLADVCNKGFEFATEYCTERDIPYVYIALVDADNILEESYFEKLIEKFENDVKLGIVSGYVASADIEGILNDLKRKDQNVTVMDDKFWQIWGSDITQIQESRDDLPMGSARMWRRECFEVTGGYLSVPLPDSVSNAMAKVKNWKTSRFEDARVIERSGLAKQGLWKGYKERGASYFFLGQSLFLTMVKALKYTFERPYYIGIAYFYGYTQSFVLRKERVNDDEIRHYYRHIRPTELKDHYKAKIKKLLKKS